MKRLLLLVLSLSFFTGECNSALFRKTEDGVYLSILQRKTNDTRSLRLQVINDDIIRVSASPNQQLSDRASLITAYTETKKSGWDAVQKGNQVVLTTAKLKVSVSLLTGEIVFRDQKDSVLLQEKTGGGKTFTPITVDWCSGYTFRQIFESPADEAFYGLGQHQSDEFNYKGKNEELYQYNTKVSVPFIVSSKHYGILWDNYSLTRFGDPRPYANIDQFTLYDKNGKKGGLTASYLINKDPKNIFTERRESTIDYENLETIHHFPKDFPFNNAAINWEGDLQPKESGLYHFILYYAGYTKVFLDGQPIVAERWRTSWNPNSYKFTAHLIKGKKHHLQIEWKPDGGVSYISLKALSPVPAEEQSRLSLWSEMGQ
jgi:alpha-D-xyloside xylohydrolase